MNETLRDKIAYEIMNALNSKAISVYLQVGRIGTSLEDVGKGTGGLDEIRPIVVRLHIAKIMEKAILAKMKDGAPLLLASQIC